MEKKKTNIFTIIIIILAFVILAGGLFAVYRIFIEKPTEGSKTITVDVVKADGSKDNYKIKTDAEYLKEAIDKDGRIKLDGSSSEYGFFLTTVNGITTDSANEEWWCVMVDGESALTGIDQLPVQDGGNYELIFTVGYEY